MGELFAEFARRFPHVELELLFPIMEDVSRLVLDGKADVGVMWRQEQLPPELGFKTIGWVPLQLVCGKTHPLAHGRVDLGGTEAASPDHGARCATKAPSGIGCASRPRCGGSRAIG